MRKFGIIALCLFAIYGLARAADVENPFRPPATTCTNQFIRSLAVLTGVGACATVNFASDGTGIVPAANGGAGTISGALKGSGAGVVTQAACADLSNGASGCSTAVSAIATQTYTATTWTPTFVGSSTPGTGQGYSTQVGSYEQIGRQITVRWRLTATSLGTAAGNLQVGGLPAAAANVANDNGQCFITIYNVTGLLAATSGMTGRVVANGSVVDLFSEGNASVSSVTITQAGSTPTIEGLCNYHV